MARIKANLTDDEANDTMVSLELESDEDYRAGGWFVSDDGGIYLIAEVRSGKPPVEVELDAILIQGPHPSTLVPTAEGLGVGFPPNATPAEQEEIARRALRWNAERKGDPVDEAEIEAKARWLIEQKARLRLQPRVDDPNYLSPKVALQARELAAQLLKEDAYTYERAVDLLSLLASALPDDAPGRLYAIWGALTDIVELHHDREEEACGLMREAASDFLGLTELTSELDGYLSRWNDRLGIA